MANMVGEATFRPLARKRYRCIQTGEVVKQARLEGYRSWYYSEVTGRRPKPKDRTNQRTVEWNQEKVNCGSCGMRNWIDMIEDAGTVTCRCRATLSIVRKKPPASARRSIWGRW